MEICPEKSAIRSLIARFEPNPVETVIKETITPKATESRPIKTIIRERLFLLSLEKAIFLEKYNGNFKRMNLALKIKDLFLIVLIYFGFCQPNFAQNIDKNCFKTGADRPELYLPLLENKTIAVVTNQTGLLKDKTFLVDFLVKNNIKIKTIFAPEHGFRGDADAGEHVKNGVDTKTGISIISLYGDNKKPKAEQLKGIDLVLFDIQDVGVRFYTYISHLHYVMEACAENNVSLILLDRPNPNGSIIDGPILEPEHSSFVGMHPIPVLHGMTIGEYALMINGQGWLKNKVQCNLTIIPCENYSRTMPYKLPVNPSPNLPNSQSINLYASLCFFEGTNVSIGRGTYSQFQIYGSPYLPKSVFNFKPEPNFGAKSPLHNGVICYGEDLTKVAKVKQLLKVR